MVLVLGRLGRSGCVCRFSGPKVGHSIAGSVPMGGSAYKERVNRCRKFCAVSLALPRGSTSTAEPVLMTLARKLAAKTAKEEWVQVHPPSWTQA